MSSCAPIKLLLFLTRIYTEFPDYSASVINTPYPGGRKNVLQCRDWLA